MIFVSVKMKILILFISLIVRNTCAINSTFSGKICAKSSKTDACQQVARNFEIACNYYEHNVDCLLGIESNQSHIARITGEDAFLGANLLTNVEVIGEIVTMHTPLQTVVIVKNNIGNDFTKLKQKKFCHPGFKHDRSVSHLLLQEFENKLLEKVDSFCQNETITLLEGRIAALSNYFSEACRPGLWTQNDDFDKILKERYPNLCQLCGYKKCDIDYSIPFNDSLKCLVDQNADVALTTAYEAEIFFKNLNNRKNYKYLCDDGRSTDVPCVWSKTIPSIIVARKDFASDMKDYIERNLKSKLNSKPRVLQSVPSVIVEQSLTDILELQRYESITLFTDSINLKNYVQKFRSIPTVDNRKMCDRTLSWCTFSDIEQAKCKWLSQAALNWDIQPVVECFQSDGNNELYCLDDIKKNEADIVVASSDYAFISFSKGLKSIAYPETDTRNLSRILAVIRADDTTSIKSFKDLKDKKACIPRFGGKEHLAFVDTIRRLNITGDDQKTCDYGQLLSDFINSSCVPGVRSSLIKESTSNVNIDKLCELCHSVSITTTSSYCNDDTGNKYYGNEGAIQCLKDSVADFAIITKYDLADNSNFSIICKNDTLVYRNDFNVDDDCALAIIPSSEVVSRENDIKNPDIILALYEFETRFGRELKKSFHLYDRFNQTLDLLFKDSTPGLNFNNDVSYIKNYKELLKNVKDCTVSSSAMIKVSTVLIFIVMLMKIYI